MNIMANKNPNTSGLTPFKPGQSGNPAGKLKGTKNLATIIEELENEDFGDWAKIPIKEKATAMAIGSPWRAIVYTAIAKAYGGDTHAAEWLRKSGYGDKLDLTSKGQRLKQVPVVVSEIKPRENHVETEAEATTGS